jgi:ketosteroid isomerase-like protein
MSEPTGASVVVGPREVFARMRREWLAYTAGSGFMDDQYADDVVIEMPFAPPGGVRRLQGRRESVAFVEAGRASLPPLRFEECRNVVIHETADPEVIVVEYELVGTVSATNRTASAAFIGVLRVRDGKIARWREYQNVLAITHELGQLPALLARMGVAQPEPAGPNARDSG